MGALCKKVPDFFARGLEVHYTRTVWRLLSKLHQSSKSAPRTLQLDPGAFASAHDHIVCDLSRFGRRGDGLPNLQIPGLQRGMAPRSKLVFASKGEPRGSFGSSGAFAGPLP